VHREWLAFYRDLLAIRRREIVARICDIVPGKAEYRAFEKSALWVRWPFRNGGSLVLLANFAEKELRIPEGSTKGRVLHEEPRNAIVGALLVPRSALWMLTE